MMHKLIIFFQKHAEDIYPGLLGGGSITLLFTNIDLILKILVAVAMLTYYGIKIYKEVKNKNIE